MADRSCVECGRLFTAPDRPRGAPRIVCSDQCRRARARRARRDRGPIDQVRICLECGSTWCNLPKRRRGRPGPTLYCSNRCQWRARARRRRTNRRDIAT